MWNNITFFSKSSWSAQESHSSCAAALQNCWTNPFCCNGKEHVFFPPLSRSMKTWCCEDETVLLPPLPPNGSFKSFQLHYVSSVSYSNTLRLVTTDIQVLKSGVWASVWAYSSLRYTHAIPAQGTSLHSQEKPAKETGCETSQCITRHKILPLSSEIHTELFHQRDLFLRMTFCPLL